GRAADDHPRRRRRRAAGRGGRRLVLRRGTLAPAVGPPRRPPGRACRPAAPLPLHDGSAVGRVCRLGSLQLGRGDDEPPRRLRVRHLGPPLPRGLLPPPRARPRIRRRAPPRPAGPAARPHPRPPPPAAPSRPPLTLLL